MFENKRGKNEKTFSVYKVFLDKFLQNSVKRRNLPVNNKRRQGVKASRRQGVMY